MRLHRVLLPPSALLARYQTVDKDGRYRKLSPDEDEDVNDVEEAAAAAVSVPATGVGSGVAAAAVQGAKPAAKQGKSGKSGNLHYVTMLMARAAMIRQSGGMLARAVTIATRYSFVRRQGFLDPESVAALAHAVIHGQDDGQYSGCRYDAQQGKKGGERGPAGAPADTAATEGAAAGRGCPYSGHTAGASSCPFSSGAGAARGTATSSAAAALASAESGNGAVAVPGDVYDGKSTYTRAHTTIRTYTIISPHPRTGSIIGTATGPPDASLSALPADPLTADVNALVVAAERTAVGPTLRAHAGVTLHRTPEWPVAHYQVQRFRLLRQIGAAYALKCAGRWMLEQVGGLEGDSVIGVGAVSHA
jgi:hypothetical protein